METVPEVILLVGRLLFVFLFVGAAVGHFKNRAMMEGYARESGMPFPSLASWPTGLWLVVASVSIVFGIWADIGAIMIVLFLAPATFYLHKFWKIEEPEQREAELLNFARNITLLGGALIIFVFFTTAGWGLDLTLTDPLIDLR